MVGGGGGGGSRAQRSTSFSHELGDAFQIFYCLVLVASLATGSGGAWTESVRRLRPNPSPTRIRLCDITRQRSIAEAVSGAAALVRGGRGSRARRSRRAPPSCLPQDKCGLIFHGLSAHVLCLSHRGVGEVSPKTSLVRLCLRLFSSHKVHRAHSRAPAVCKSQPLCQCCCAPPLLHHRNTR